MVFLDIARWAGKGVWGVGRRVPSPPDAGMRHRMPLDGRMPYGRNRAGNVRPRCAGPCFGVPCSGGQGTARPTHPFAWEIARGSPGEGGGAFSNGFPKGGNVGEGKVREMVFWKNRFLLSGDGDLPYSRIDVWPGMPCAGHGMRHEVPLSDSSNKNRYLLA